MGGEICVLGSNLVRTLEEYRLYSVVMSPHKVRVPIVTAYDLRKPRCATTYAFSLRKKCLVHSKTTLSVATDRQSKHRGPTSSLDGLCEEIFLIGSKICATV